VPLGDAVCAVDVLLDEPGEQLEQRDARVVQVVVGPAGRVAREERAALLDEVVPAASVEVRERQRH
jgi:hypothetical protein